MDSLKVGSGLPVESANMTAIKEAFRAFSEDGVNAGVEALLRCAHEDCVFRPFSAGSTALHGHDEVRAHFRRAQASGGSSVVRPKRFEENGDEIVVTGSIRVLRQGGGFAESQVRWIYTFRDGLVQEAHWGPRA
jgi:ketosteroid isomerase-like protein